MGSKAAADKKNNMKGVTVHSIKTKVASLVVGELVLMAVLLLFLVIPKARGLMGNTTQNYLHDVTVSYGKIGRAHV